jgi:hypothetical protein
LSYAHLTIYSLNKTNTNFEENTDAEHADRGHKRSLSSILNVLKQDGVDVEAVKARIEDIIRLTVISVQPLMATNYRTASPWHDGKSRCFELLGFDIMLDKHGRAWLLEVNWAPSLATGSPFDIAIKKSVVTGALKIVNISPHFERTVINRRRAISQARDVGSVFDVNEELEIAKATQFRLIYPLPQSHPRFECTEHAFQESKTSTVGAAVQPARVKARKEALIAQIRAKDQPPPKLLACAVHRPPPIVQPPIPDQPITRPTILDPPIVQPPPRSIALESQPLPPIAPQPVRPDPDPEPTEQRPRLPRGAFGTASTRLIAPVPKPRPAKPSPSPRPALLVHRIVAPIPAPTLPPRSVSLFLQWPGTIIDLIEENERLAAMRRQLCTVDLRSVPGSIVKFLGGTSPAMARRAPARNHFQVTNLMKALSLLPPQ